MVLCYPPLAARPGRSQPSNFPLEVAQLAAPLKLPIAHLTARVPWHDRGWDGHTCNAPVANTYCTVLNPNKEFSGCGLEMMAGLKVAFGFDRIDLVGGNGRDDVNEGVDDG